MPPLRLVVFAGPPCSGKSLLASWLAARRGLTHLEMDAVRLKLMPGAAHTRADREVAYRSMHFTAGCLLKLGHGVILDASYAHLEDREETRKLAGNHGARLVWIECRVGAATAVQRFRDRSPDPVRVDLTAERVADLAQNYPYTGNGLTLDTDALNPEECGKAIEAYLTSGC